METVVLDTSVVVKWFVEENGSKKAQGLLKRYVNKDLQIIVPEIICLELANALFFGAGFKKKDLSDALHAFYSLRIEMVQFGETFVKQIAEFMVKFRVPMYDSSFVFLAKNKKIPLITADRKHHSKKFYKNVKYI